MKTLLLIRHAKSSWDLPGRSDHDRPLNERGNRDGPAMSAALAQRGVRPQRILCSTAVRARETAAHLVDGLGIPPGEVEYSGDLYLASSRKILRCAAAIDESVDSAMLVGHNPGMQDAVERLCGEGSVDRFPTLSVARIELAIDFWGAVEPGSGTLVEHLTPRDLREG